MHRTAIVTRADADDTLELPVVPPEALRRTSFTLRVLGGPDVGSLLVLDPESPPHAVLGQASSCAIPLRDPCVSRKHIALTATPTHLLLVDLGSTNGTRVNGVLVREARLYGGETIEMGRTMLGVESDAEAAANTPSTMPPPADEPKDFLATVLADRLPFTEARQRVVAEFERRYVEDLLARHNGNVTHAARASGIAHRYFQLVRARSLK
jgi:hypothetical protein